MWRGAKLESWAHNEANEFCFKHPPASIAEKVGVTRHAVEKWRKNPRYVQGVIWFASQKATATYHKPHGPQLGDPEEGEERDGMIFSGGVWRELDLLRKEQKEDRDREDYLARSRSPALRRKMAAYHAHKAKKPNAT